MRYALALFATTIGTAHAAAQAATSRHSVDDQAFVIEHQSRVVRFDSSGTGRIDLYSAILVQSEAGVRALGELAFDYDSAFSRLDIDTVEVRKGTGGRVLAPASAVQDVTGPIGREAPTYSDLRQKIITVPGLQPGDTIAYHLTWTIDRPLAPGEFWYSAPFIRRAVDLDDHVQLVVRASQYVNIKTRGGPAPIVTDSAGWRLYRWRDANLEIDTLAEPGKRPDGVEITSFRDWTAVATWYAGLERPREAATTALGEKAAELVRGKTSLADSIAALFAYVSQQIRYVSLSFGIGHYQPHAAADVMANAYGDCKDKHVLLASLLRSIGVASAPVLIGTEQDADSTLPTPLAFNHLITLVPLRTDTLWLDATPDVAPFRYLGITVRDRHALVIPADAPARLVRSPAALPFPAFEDVV
ncbi:MAG TPA: DUF3857 and transglutaminase domain-containing protein, partial [Gemmatimonadales bacterium]|nr:DUF3857 and transglutaminase domain-containing protein [Gemmatimonadales bacterium]